MKQFICIFCAVALIAGTVLPSIISTVSAADGEEVTLSDGSSWLTTHNTEYNVLATDGEGRYTMSTTAPNSGNSAFSLLSAAVYPLSTQYQLRCREAANATTSFGLTSEYSLDLNDENSIIFTRKNGSPSENAAKLFVTVNNTDVCILTTAASYTRNRVSTVAVVKKNGSWYMSWNGLVLDGDGCSEEVREYCKLENHFPAEALAADLPLHFYASCSSMNVAEAFLLKADRALADGVLTVAADTYSDANNPASVTKVTAPAYEYESERGTYKLSFSSNDTKAAVMAPVTAIDPETGESGEFGVESFLYNISSSGQCWMEYIFSNDPTFSDGTEIAFCAVKLANNAGVHLGYFNSSSTWITSCGMNNNFYNDPYDSARSFQFKTDSKTGQVYLYIWGANLTSKTTPHVANNDFSSLVGKPIYMAVRTRSIGTATARVDITPETGAETAEYTAAVEELAARTPTDLAEAEEMIAEYDASAYRYAISKNGLAKILDTRMYMFAEREALLQSKLKALREKIDALPAVDELEFQYTAELKDEICEVYLEYAALGDNMDRLDAEYADKLNGLLDKLTELDVDFSEKKQAAVDFAENVAALGEPEDINVENYAEKSGKINELRELYESMDEFLCSLVDESALDALAVLEERLPAVKAAYDVVGMIKLLPEMENVSLTDETAITETRAAYNRLAEKELVSSELLKRLEDCEAQLETVKIRDLDWYSVESKVTYTGNNSDSYTFANTVNEINGNAVATTTAKYDMTINHVYWIGMSCGSSQFMILGLSNTVKGQQLSNNSTDNISFILRPGAGNTMSISFYDAAGESERIAVFSAFNLDGMHTFGFEKAEDGHWYLVVDGSRCDRFSYARLDNYMEQYGKSTHVSIGGRNGFRASNVVLIDKNASNDTEDWAFSLPFGCSSVGDTLAATVNLKQGAQAIYQNKIDILNNKITLNMNLQDVKATNTVIGLLSEPDAFGNYTSSSKNGVVLRIYNRPASFPQHTHINIQFEGGNITRGFQPTILDTSYISISVEKSTDNHYYMRLEWETGSWLVKLDRSNENYRNVQLDNLVENGGYFMVGTTSHDINVDFAMEYTENSDEDEATEDTAAITNFILEFERYFDKLNARSKEAYEYIHSEWLKLDFVNRNSVTADLMDDEAAYNLLLTVIDYEDGKLDEFYTVTEEMYVTESQLNGLIAEYEQDDSADYTIIYAANDTVMHTIKNLSAPDAVTKLPIETERGANTAVTVLASAAVLAGVSLILAGRKRSR